MSGATTMEELARAVIGEAARACDARAGALLVDEQEAGVWLYFVDPGGAVLPEATRALGVVEGGTDGVNDGGRSPGI